MVCNDGRSGEQKFVRVCEVLTRWIAACTHTRQLKNGESWAMHPDSLHERTGYNGPATSILEEGGRFLKKERNSDNGAC